MCRSMAILRTFLVLLMLGIGLWPSQVLAQEKTTVTLNLKDVTLNEVISEIKKQTNYDFFYKSELLKSKGQVSVNVKNKDVKAVLEDVLLPLGLEFLVQQNLITIREKATPKDDNVQMITVKGKVTDKDGNPVIGATVVIYGTTQGVATDIDLSLIHI